MARSVIEIKEESYNKLMANLAEIPVTVGEKTQRIIGETILNIQADTIEPASFPVITGNLRASYDIDLQPGEGAVYSELDYAPYIEFGTMTGIRPQPYLMPAYEKHIPIFFRAMEKMLENEIK